VAHPSLVLLLAATRLLDGDQLSATTTCCCCWPRPCTRPLAPGLLVGLMTPGAGLRVGVLLVGRAAAPPVVPLLLRCLLMPGGRAAACSMPATMFACLLLLPLFGGPCRRLAGTLSSGPCTHAPCCCARRFGSRRGAGCSHLLLLGCCRSCCWGRGGAARCSAPHSVLLIIIIVLIYHSFALGACSPLRLGRMAAAFPAAPWLCGAPSVPSWGQGRRPLTCAGHACSTSSCCCCCCCAA
jgi:hypothetical protein